MCRREPSLPGVRTRQRTCVVVLLEHLQADAARCRPAPLRRRSRWRQPGIVDVDEQYVRLRNEAPKNTTIWSTLVKSGNGELTLSNANTYTGGTTVTQGTLSFAHTNGANIVDALGSGAVTLDGSTLRNAAGASPSLTNNIVLGAGGGTIHDGGNGLSLNGTITGTGSLILQGNQFILLAGAATHTGATTIESGVSLLLAGTGTPLAASTSAFRIASGGTFNLFWAKRHDRLAGRCGRCRWHCHQRWFPPCRPHDRQRQHVDQLLGHAPGWSFLAP